MTANKPWTRKGKLIREQRVLIRVILYVYDIIKSLSKILKFIHRSDTESAEHHSTKGDANDGEAVGDVENGGGDKVDEPKKDSHKTSVAAKMSNFFVAMKKSVHSKSNKEKYEQTESEMKVIDIFHYYFLKYCK